METTICVLLQTAWFLESGHSTEESSPNPGKPCARAYVSSWLRQGTVVFEPADASLRGLSSPARSAAKDEDDDFPYKESGSLLRISYHH